VDRVAEHLPFQVTDGPHSAAKKDCLRCHPAVRSDKPFGADFGSFDCLDCHDQAKADEKHAGMLEYRYASAACYECHPTGRKD
jgi:predicted CXXCH cytochrome family protein